jgi:type I restriction enzyme S subunit
MYKLVKLSTIANISTGFPFKGEKYSNQGTRVVRGENVTVGSLRWDSIKCWNQRFWQSEKYSLKDGDVVIGMDGSKVGKNRARVKKVDLPLLLAQRVALIRNNELSNQNFLYYLIRANSFEEYVERIQTGSSVPHISQKQIEEYPVPFINVEIQKKISDVLLSLDSKIEHNNRINAELEAMAKTLYDYWFVQFDFPNKNSKPYKTSGGKMVWNEELKREVPEGWKVNKIEDILRTSLGGTPSTTVKEYWEGGTNCWLNSGEIVNFPIIDSELKITDTAIKNSSTNLLPKGSVMLSITRHLRPSILGIDACANQSVVGIYEKGNIRSYFLYPYLQNEIPRLMAMRSGAQQPHINKEVVDESLILTPPESSNILKYYNKEVGNLYDLIINNAFQNQKLTELRDWLLPMLMNGQVKVKDQKEAELSMAVEAKI